VAAPEKIQGNIAYKILFEVPLHLLEGCFQFFADLLVPKLELVGSIKIIFYWVLSCNNKLEGGESICWEINQISWPDEWETGDGSS